MYLSYPPYRMDDNMMYFCPITNSIVHFSVKMWDFLDRSCTDFLLIPDSRYSLVKQSNRIRHAKGSLLHAAIIMLHYK